MKTKLEAALLMLFTLGALGEVVDFSTCKYFFRDGKPPRFSKRPREPVEDERYIQICQVYQNTYHYATLYDTHQKIPVFSAYLYTKSQNCTVERPEITWMIELQIENKSNKGEMALQGRMNGSGRQAYNSDYKDSRYDKGHLYPHCHAPSTIAAKSTFTLTNAAPQRCDFNNFWYNKVESQVRGELDQCLKRKETAYVVTGVVPNVKNQYLKKNSTVNVPTHFWTAYSCCDNNKKCTFGGFIMGRDDDEPQKIDKDVEFNGNLSNLYPTTFKLF